MEAQIQYSTATLDVDNCVNGLWGAVADNEAAQLKIPELSRRIQEARDELVLTQALAIDLGYASGHIQGKNAEERGRAETILLSGNKDYHAAKKRVQDLEFRYELAKTEAELATKRVGAWREVVWVKGAQLLNATEIPVGGNGHGAF